MRKWIWALVALIAVVAPAGGGMLTDVSHAADNTVTVNDQEFAPAEITVPVGTDVIFKNTSTSAPHSAKAKDGSWNSGYISPGSEGKATMKTAGDFPYYCEPHPWKKGVVHVK